MDRRTILALELYFIIFHKTITVDQLDKFISIPRIAVEIFGRTNPQKIFLGAIAQHIDPGLVHIQNAALQIGCINHVVTAFKNPAKFFLSFGIFLLQPL